MQLVRGSGAPRRITGARAKAAVSATSRACCAVIIHGAAGNVGAYAVQLARLRSIATAGTKDIQYVRSLGADNVLDYHTQHFEDELKDGDVVLDLVGGEAQMRSFQILRGGGKLISAVSEPDQRCAEDHGVTTAFFLVGVTAHDPPI